MLHLPTEVAGATPGIGRRGLGGMPAASPCGVAVPPSTPGAAAGKAAKRLEDSNLSVRQAAVQALGEMKEAAAPLRGEGRGAPRAP